MGGDDLDSDDDYLNPVVRDTEDVLDSLISEENGDVIGETQGPLKRKHIDMDHLVDGEPEEVPSKKSSARVLLEAGRNLSNETTDVQAKFLWTALTHNLQLKGESTGDIPRLQASHFLASTETTLPARLKSAISTKKLKKWKNIPSPMVIVVCVSARRAVAVLKELACLKVRAAKLFAKHMDVRQQRSMLQQQAFGLAVGTPHRLQVLCQTQSHGGALSLQHTQIVLLDTHANSKGYTVCTLPDTAPDCMKFLRDSVLPESKKRKDLKIAMF